MTILEKTIVQLCNGSNQNDGKPAYLEIAAGLTESTSLDIFGATLLGFAFPANTTTADFSLKVSLDGSTYYNLTDAYTGNPIDINAVAGDYARVLPQDTVGVKFIKLVSSAPQVSDVRIQVIAGQLL